MIRILYSTLTVEQPKETLSKAVTKFLGPRSSFISKWVERLLERLADNRGTPQTRPVEQKEPVLVVNSGKETPDR